MSLSPPKFIQMLRRRDQDDLLVRLRALVSEWEDPHAEVIDGLASRQRCAYQLQKTLDAYH